MYAPSINRINECWTNWPVQMIEVLVITAKINGEERVAKCMNGIIQFGNNIVSWFSRLLLLQHEKASCWNVWTRAEAS